MKQLSETSFDFNACLFSVIENSTFLLGMMLMFSKTVDLMTAFAPRVILGYEGVEGWYGLACGVLVEGALFAMKLMLNKARNVFEWAWNVLVVIAPFLISAAAQVFDSFLVRETLAQQPAEVQVFVTWFVPSIPTVIVLLFIGKAIFNSIPAEILPKGLPVSRGSGGFALPHFRWPWARKPQPQPQGKQNKPQQGKSQDKPAQEKPEAEVDPM